MCVSWWYQWTGLRVVETVSTLIATSEWMDNLVSTAFACLASGPSYMSDSLQILMIYYNTVSYQEASQQ